MKLLSREPRGRDAGPLDGDHRSPDEACPSGEAGDDARAELPPGRRPPWATVRSGANAPPAADSPATPPRTPRPLPSRAGTGPSLRLDRPAPAPSCRCESTREADVIVAAAVAVTATRGDRRLPTDPHVRRRCDCRWRSGAPIT